MSRGAVICAVVVLLAFPARAINLGGTEVPPERFIVYLFIGPCIMAGETGRDTGDTQTNPNAWNYKFDDNTDAWIPARSPLHRGQGSSGDGPGMPFLKGMVDLFPDYYFGIIQNAESGNTCSGSYRRGSYYYDEIIDLTTTLRAQSSFTIGGIVSMLGLADGERRGTAEDFADQFSAMVDEMRADLDLPDLPVLISRMSGGYTYRSTIRDQVDILSSRVTTLDIVPSDGPYQPSDGALYTWEGQVLWGQAAAQLIETNGWLPVGDASSTDENTAEDSPLTAVITGPTLTIVNEAASYFADNSAGGATIVDYQWSFGDGNIATGQLVTHTWDEPGDYAVSLAVTDAGGAQTGAALSVRVSAELQPFIELLSPMGGEVWPAGSTQRIEWTTTNLSDVRIDFSPDGGESWSLVDFSDIHESDWGVMPWTVPEFDCTSCSVMIRGYHLESPVQSAPFTIGPGTMDNLSLVGGCSSSGGSKWGVVSAIALLAMLRRRRG